MEIGRVKQVVNFVEIDDTPAPVEQDVTVVQQVEVAETATVEAAELVDAK